MADTMTLDKPVDAKGSSKMMDSKAKTTPQKAGLAPIPDQPAGHIMINKVAYDPSTPAGKAGISNSLKWMDQNDRTTITTSKGANPVTYLKTNPATGKVNPSFISAQNALKAQVAGQPQQYQKLIAQAQTQNAAEREAYAKYLAEQAATK